MEASPAPLIPCGNPSPACNLPSHPVSHPPATPRSGRGPTRSEAGWQVPTACGKKRGADGLDSKHPNRDNGSKYGKAGNGPACYVTRVMGLRPVHHRIAPLGHGGLLSSAGIIAALAACSIAPQRYGPKRSTLTRHSACTFEPTRCVAGNAVTFHAGFAHINALTKLPGVIVTVSLGDARTLLFGMRGLLPARRKPEGCCRQNNEASKLHRAFSNR